MNGAGKNPRVFADTNVFFSGFYSPDGPPGIILRMMLEHRVILVISRQVLEEIVRTFKAKLPRTLPALRRFLLNSPFEIVDDPTVEEAQEWEPFLEDGDASILAAAINAAPDFFVTGDGHFLQNEKLKSKSGLVILSPSEFIQLYRKP